MSRLFPRSIAGQIIFVLLVGLTVSHMISMVLYSANRAEILTMAGGHQISHRIAGITRLIEETPVSWRARILQATNSETLSVTIAPVSQLPDDGADGLVNSLLQKYLSQLIGTDDLSRVVVRVINIQDGLEKNDPNSKQQSDHAMLVQFLHGSSGGQFIRASVKLRDGRWLNFATTVADEEPFWSIKMALSMLLMAVAVVFISIWVIRRITLPLEIFTAASERFGKDVSAPPLDVKGPQELQRATIAFNKMQERLRNMIENRTQMLAAISHDLRTPITLLRLRTEAVEDKDERIKMQATLGEMEAIISSTLSFAREDAESEQFEQVNLTALLISICDDFSDTGYSVSFSGGPSLIYKCRPNAFRRAFSNLVQNAVKYGSDASVSLQQAPNAVEVRIEDNGPGIPNDQLSKVFRPFYRVDASRGSEIGGIGLGLSVAQSVFDKVGGVIKLSNLEGGGLQVNVILPS